MLERMQSDRNQRKRRFGEGREMKESRMSQGNEASANAIDDVIARAVRELDLDDKVELLTGAAAFSLHGNEAIGLRPMIFSDGPTGVRGSEFVGGKKVALFPNATLLAQAWDETAAERVGEMLAGKAALRMSTWCSAQPSICTGLQLVAGCSRRTPKIPC
jgi:beta-glucosidase-like glycosyl hydrolase